MANFINYSPIFRALPVCYIQRPERPNTGGHPLEEIKRQRCDIAYFLLPKSNVAYLYDDYTFRQGLEKMRYHGYTAIPVITRNGTYVGTVSEGDFLWQLLSDETKQQRLFP